MFRVIFLVLFYGFPFQYVFTSVLSSSFFDVLFPLCLFPWLVFLPFFEVTTSDCLPLIPPPGLPLPPSLLLHSQVASMWYQIVDADISYFRSDQIIHQIYAQPGRQHNNLSNRELLREKTLKSAFAPIKICFGLLRLFTWIYARDPWHFEALWNGQFFFPKP